MIMNPAPMKPWMLALMVLLASFGTALLESCGTEEMKTYDQMIVVTPSGERLLLKHRFGINYEVESVPACPPSP